MYRPRMSTPTIEAVPSNWEAPLGHGLPVAGPTKLLIWPYVLGGVALLGILGGGACFAYPFLLPATVLAAQVSHHESLREAALSWRAEYAKSAAFASKLQVWHRGTFEASCCGEVVPADTDVGDFMLVLPLDEGAETETSRDKRVLRLPAESWTPAIQVLSEQVQFAAVGDEMLVRGAVVVSLSSQPSGAKTLIVSADSPPSGVPNMGVASLAPFAGCLPALPAEDVGALLASPQEQPTDGAYWIAWRGESVSLLRLAPCAAASAVPLEVRRFPNPAGYLPLLTFMRSPSPTPFILQLAPKSHGPPRLLRPKATEPDQLEVVGEIMENGIGKASGTSIDGAGLFDSFQPGLPGSGPGGAQSPVRHVGEAGVRHLVPESEGWTFAQCTNPEPNHYLVVEDSCGSRGGEYVNLERPVIDSLSACRKSTEPRPGAFDDSLGSAGKTLRSRDECIALAYYIHPDFEDLECNLRVTPAHCAEGAAADDKK